MHIREIRTYHVSLPVKGASYRMARAEVTELDSTLVEIVADNGLSGWGETCPIGPVYQPHHARGARAALDEILPGLLGMDLYSPRAIGVHMDRLLSGHGYAKAAVDIAILDLVARSRDMQVCELLGGALTDRVPSYYSTTLGEPAEIARIARERRDEGYPRIQVKVGQDVEHAIETVRRVHEAIGTSVRIAVDANGGLTMRDALRLSTTCAAVPFVFEQPCATMEEVMALRGRIHHAIYLDENTESLNAVLRAISSNAADGFGFKVTRLGGLSNAAVARDLCALRSLPHTCDDAWGGDVIAAACVHLAATVDPRLMEGAWIAEPYTSGIYDPDRHVTVSNGHIRLPQGPGLGVTPNRDVLGEPASVHGG